jgi:hypothetical protein
MALIAFRVYPGLSFQPLLPKRRSGYCRTTPCGAFPYYKVVVFLLDAFGWNFFEEFRKESDFLSGLCDCGSAAKLCTQFPSATACNVTTMNTGMSVAEHGVFEWFYYEPRVGEVIAPMLYSCGKRIHERDSLKSDASLKPGDIYPNKTLYKSLLDHGVRSYTFQDHAYAISAYSDAVFEGAQRYGYVTPADGLVNLAHYLINKPSKAYFYYYFDRIDSISHVYGTGSKELKAEATAFFASLEKVFWDEVKDKVDHTLFVLTADHGQISINPDRCVYLNLDFPGLEKYLRRSVSGRPLAPAGSCRDMFLYVREDCLDEALGFLRNELDGKAIVVKTGDLIEAGYFGRGRISEALAGRLGNLVILPLDGESAWWYEKGLFEIKYLGHHGGLTRQEMEIPFLAWEL